MTLIGNAFGPGREVDVCPVCGVVVLVPYDGEPDYPQRHGRESHGEAANMRERLDRAKAALVATGYFTADQVSDDIAPRIIELHSALSPTAAAQVSAARAVADEAAADTARALGDT